MANDSAENEKQAPQTAGQRLAASRAAKSARKAAEKGRQAELMEDKALAQAAVAKDWLADNIKTLGLAAAGVLVVATIGIVWSSISTKKNVEAGGALAGVLTSNIYEDDELASAFGKVVTEHEGTVAATWALIGEGRALYGASKHAQALEAYQAALDSTDDETMQWVALEGMAYTLEAQSSYDDAIAQLDALGRLNSEIEPIADYHQARILMAQGKNDEAKSRLQRVLAALRRPGAVALPFTQAQAEARLTMLDPSLAPRTGPDMRAIEDQLNQMMRQQQGQAAP